MSWQRALAQRLEAIPSCPFSILDYMDAPQVTRTGPSPCSCVAPDRFPHPAATSTATPSSPRTRRAAVPEIRHTQRKTRSRHSPTLQRARLILRKGGSHRLENVALRRLSEPPSSGSRWEDRDYPLHSPCFLAHSAASLGRAPSADDLPCASWPRRPAVRCLCPSPRRQELRVEIARRWCPPLATGAAANPIDRPPPRMMLLRVSFQRRRLGRVSCSAPHPRRRLIERGDLHSLATRISTDSFIRVRNSGCAVSRGSIARAPLPPP